MPCAAPPRPARGVQDILEWLILKVPPPEGDPDAPLQALIVDSWFDNYVGVVMLGACEKWHAAPERQDFC